MSKKIRDQLAVVQRMIDHRLRQASEPLVHLDEFRALAALAETQLHLVRALEGKPLVADAQEPADEFDSSRFFIHWEKMELIDWPIDDWECPACGGERFLMIDALPPSQARPSKDPRWVLAELDCRCHDCNFECQSGTAALSWHREQAGLPALGQVARYREGLT